MTSSDFVEDLKGNELSKTPNLIGDLTLRYETWLDNDTGFTDSIEYHCHGGLSWRIFDNAETDHVDYYEVVNLVTCFNLPKNPLGLDGDVGLDFVAMNVLNEVRC